MIESSGLHPRARCALVSCVFAATTTLATSTAWAQAEPTVIFFETRDDCATESQARRLVEAIETRVPGGEVVTEAADGAQWTVSLVWQLGSSGNCELVLSRDEKRSTLELPDGADEGAIRNAASRIAWLVSTIQPVAEPAPEATADPEPEPAADPDLEPEPEPEPEAEPEPEPEAEAPPEPPAKYRTVLLRASLLPSLAHPSGDGSDVVSNYSLNFVGSQAGLEGVELGFLLNSESDYVHGVQAALGGNLVGGEVRGAQFGLGFNWAEHLQGAQFAVGLNRASDVAGLQVGLVNVGDDVDGLQLGLVNVAAKSDVSIGLININHDRPLYVTAWGNEIGMMHLGVQHGSRYLRWSLSGGVAPFGNGLASAGVGLGGHFLLRWVYLELDAMTHGVASLEGHSAGLLNQLRLTLGIPIGERFAVYAGGSANVLFTEPIDDTGQVLSFDETTFARRIEHSGSADVWVWPGFFAGLRF